MNPTTGQDFDVVVVGGGPAGATAATLVAMRGHRVLLLEKHRFPRYQIGESLLPATVHGVCRILGVADEVARAGFTLKRGGTFRWGANPNPWQFLFALSPRLPDPTALAYQVERAKFDAILLRNAARTGVDVREGCHVTGIVADGQRVRGVSYTASTPTSSATSPCSATSPAATGCPDPTRATSSAPPSTRAGCGTSRYATTSPASAPSWAATTSPPSRRTRAAPGGT